MRSLFEEEEKEDAINQLTVDLIARYYPLSNEEVVKYQGLFFTKEPNLIWNKLINWDYDLIEALKDIFDWDHIWYLPNIKFDISFFQKYESKINFEAITTSHNIIWSDEFVKAYGDRFIVNSSNLFSAALSNINFIRIHKDRMDWGKSSYRLNFGFTDNYINEFKDYLDWDSFSNNPHLPLTFEFYQKYKDKWNIDNLSSNPASLPLIYEFPTKINWNWDQVILNNGITYDQKSFDFIFKHYESAHALKDIESDFLKKNPIVYFLHSLIVKERDISFFFNSKYLKYMQFDLLSKKDSIKMSKEFIEVFKDKLNFKERNLIKNIKDVIDENFIIQNHMLFDFNHYSIYDLPISRETLFKYSSDINWNLLSRSQKLDWDWEFIQENWDKLNDYHLKQNKGVYEKLIFNSLSKDEILIFLDSQLFDKK